MPQSLSNILIHLVFSTRERRRCFRMESWRDETAGYLTGVLQGEGCHVVRIGVVVDHVHVLFGLGRTSAVSDVVRKLKAGSTPWVKQQEWARQCPDFAQFHWQKGYGAFSVSESRANAVKGYIDNQAEHHKRATFQDEYRMFLSKHGITFDERYVWE